MMSAQSDTTENRDTLRLGDEILKSSKWTTNLSEEYIILYHLIE